jgi:aminoglycoside phosphotransferase (APT) family kinase protein
VELTAATAETYFRHAFEQMLSVADRVGEPGINERQLGDHTNAIAALVVHCCGVTEFWLGHLVLGRPSDRDRESEFSRTATLAELHELVDDTLARAIGDIRRIDAGGGRDTGGRLYLPGDDTSDTGVVLHVLEELYQHLGHMELAADALQHARLRRGG